MTHGRVPPVELERYVCRATTLHSLFGQKQTQETAHHTYALAVLQVSDDARAGAVLNDFAQVDVAARRPDRARSIYTLTVNTLAAADLPLEHVAKPDRGNVSLRFVYGAAGYLDMTKLLLGIFAVKLVQQPPGAPPIGSEGDGLRLHGWA